MSSPTTAQGLLGHLPQGADPPANNLRATTPPVRFLTYSSLRAISAARAGSRSAWGGTSGRRGPREVGRGGEGGEAESKGWSVGDGLCRPQRRRKESWGISHGARIRPPTTDVQQPLPSNRQHLRPYGRYWRPGPGTGARGEGRAAAGSRGRWGEAERGGEAESKGWSVGSDATSDAETEEDEGGHAPLTTLPWGTQEIGARGLQGDVRAGGSDGWKVTSATANEGVIKVR